MIFHVNEELPEKEVLLLKQYKGVMVRDLKDVWDGDDLTAVNNNTNMFRSFDCKILALLHSPFEQTMLIDSDTLFFEDPALLFNKQEVKDTGTLFFYDRHAIDPNPNLIKGNDKCNSIVNFARLADMQTSMLVDFKRAHLAYCKDLTSHEQDASLVLVDSTHPSAAKFLQMLKTFHTKYIVKNAAVQQWGFGDKEFYWLSCEFAGIHCSFSPRGRPMHLFFESNYEDSGSGSRSRMIRTQSDAPRPGCSVQVSLEGDGSGLLYANLSDKYCPWDTKLNAVTVWNPSQPDPTSRQVLETGDWVVRAGRGDRPLTRAEQTICNAYRNDVGRFHNV